MAKMDPNWTDTQKRIWTEGQKALDTIVSYSGREVPALSQGHTATAMLDETGPVHYLNKMAEKTVNTMKERLKALLPMVKDSAGRDTEQKVKALVGDRYKMEVRTSERSALNQGAAKAFLEKLGDIQPDRLLSFLKEMPQEDYNKLLTKEVQVTIDPKDGTEPYVQKTREKNCIQSCWSTATIDATYIESL